MDYSTKNISTALVEELLDALKNIRGWGSVEIQVQDFKVVQITERNIKKTNVNEFIQGRKKSSVKQVVKKS